MWSEMGDAKKALDNIVIVSQKSKQTFIVKSSYFYLLLPTKSIK